MHAYISVNLATLDWKVHGLMDKGCSLQNPGHNVENSRACAGNYKEYPSSSFTKKGRINVAP